MSLSPAAEAQFIKRLESMGETEVRLKLPTGGWAPALEPIVTKWLGDKEREAARLRDVSQAEQIEIARSASLAAQRAADAAERASAAAERQATAAERANTRATIALTIAIVSIIATTVVAVIDMWITHTDAKKLGLVLTYESVSG
jgi:hypothetical protein